MMGALIRVLLAEDDELIREAPAGLLEREPDIDVVSTAGDGRQATERASSCRPNVAVIDLQMPKLVGLSVIAELGRHCPTVPE